MQLLCSLFNLETYARTIIGAERRKNLEFKENSAPLQRIVHTAIAFANTAGGIILLGIKDRTKEVVGLKNVLEDELKISNAIATSVSPLLIPSFQFSSWRGRDLLIISIPHSLGPYYFTSKGEEEGAFIRLGSTNRIADARTLVEIKRLKEHIAFDRLPDCKHSPDELDFELAKRLFDHTGKPFTKATAKSFELLTEYQSKLYPSKGGLLLFGKNREELFPDPLIRLARFEGTDKHKVLDHLDLRSPLSGVLDEILNFIRRNTSLGAIIRDIRREDIPQYLPLVLREAKCLGSCGLLNGITYPYWHL